MTLSDIETFLIDEIALSDSVQKNFDTKIKGLSKKSKKRKEISKPPKPMFVNQKHWKGKKWDKWS